MTNIIERSFNNLIIDKEFTGKTDLCEIFLVIYHQNQDRPQILLSKHNSQLPCIRVKPCGVFPFTDTILWVPKAREKLGLSFDMIFLKCIWYKNWDPIVTLYQAILLLESHGSVTEPPINTKWEDCSHLPVPHPDANEAIQMLITEFRTMTPPSPLCPLFTRLGWFQEARSWMESQLAKNGFADIREVKQLVSTFRGTVFEANTSRGHVYLKCSPFFVNEALVAEKMSRLLPEHVETPIAIDVDKRLLLMRDYGEIIEPWSMIQPERDQWLQELARIHQATIGKEDILQEAGLKVIPVKMLPAKLEDLLKFFEASELASANVIEQFKQLWPQIRSDCRVIQDIEIPMTFIHGDIFFGNVYRPAVAGGHYGMIDWAKSAISHPFFDAVMPLSATAYLNSWQSFLSRTGPENNGAITLERLFQCHYLCTRVKPLFVAVILYLETFEAESPMPREMRRYFCIVIRQLMQAYNTNN